MAKDKDLSKEHIAWLEKKAQDEMDKEEIEQNEWLKELKR